MSGNIDAHGHYWNGGIPDEIAENLKDFFPEHDGLSYEEVLLEQASFYQSFQGNGMNSDTTTDDVHSSNRQMGESSRTYDGNATSQEALDEALARSLQDLGDDFDDFFISEHNGSTESPVAPPTRVVSRELRQDDVDPDNMTYEELGRLGETVGIKSKGLSKDLISRLPTCKYKTGMFSKKKEKEDCVVCQMAFSSGVRLTTLPCAHQYHSKCIRKWLKQSKNCPVCQNEVLLD